MRRWLRRASSWKFVVYELLLPLLRVLGPARCDAAPVRPGQSLDLALAGTQATADPGAPWCSRGA